MLKVLLSTGNESSLTHHILEGSAQILYTREVVVEFGQKKNFVSEHVWISTWETSSIPWTQFSPFVILQTQIPMF